MNKNNLDKVLEDLQYIKNDLKCLKAWKSELELIEEKINAYKDINYNELGYKSGGSTTTLDDILLKDEAKQIYLDSKITFLEYRIEKMRVYLNILNEDEKIIISKRYLEDNKEKFTFEKLAKILSVSKTSAKRIHDSAIVKIAFYKYENIGIA